MNAFSSRTLATPRVSLRVLSVTMLALAATVAPAMAGFIPISSCPFTISTPGDYQLTTNLACGGNAITINVSGVSLKLNGYTITAGSAASSAILVQGTGQLNHVTVSGPGLITGPFVSGVNILNTDYAQVSQVTVMGTINGGIVVGSSNYATVGSNVADHNSDYGIYLGDCNHCTVSGNDASGNGTGGAGGINFVGGSNNTVNNNTANGNNFFGIAINSPGTRAFANVANGNSNLGIWVDSIGVEVFNNTSAVANGGFDLYDSNTGCAGTVWSSDVFFTANQACVK